MGFGVALRDTSGVAALAAVRARWPQTGGDGCSLLRCSPSPPRGDDRPVEGADAAAQAPPPTREPAAAALADCPSTAGPGKDDLPVQDAEGYDIRHGSAPEIAAASAIVAMVTLQEIVPCVFELLPTAEDVAAVSTLYDGLVFDVDGLLRGKRRDHGHRADTGPARRR